MSYNRIYKKRLNRYGTDYQSRIQNKREENFHQYLQRSTSKVIFEFNGKIEEGSFERNRQSNTKTLCYLLTDRKLSIPVGTIVMLPDHNKEEKPWMVYWEETIQNSGYNKYSILKMTHFLKWEYEDYWHESWAYMYGQEDNMLKDEIRSRSRSSVIYGENSKLDFFIMPLNPYIKKELYFEVGDEPYTEGYRVTGYDRQSTPGVQFVTVDPVYLYDKSEKPVKKEEDDEDDFFWFNGGGYE